MLKAMDLDGKKALVTGGGKRIGKAIALALADAGADVVVHYRSSAKEAEETAVAVRAAGRRSETAAMDLSDENVVGSWFGDLSDRWGGIDILVNSASEFPDDDYDGLTADALGLSMAVHVLSPLRMMRRLGKTGRDACVVNILDTRVIDRDAVHASYHLGKRGLFTLTKDMAAELAPKVRVNAVAPGLILPPAGKGEEWLEQLKETNPLGGHGSADDVADAVLYLVGARFVTGQVIFVDGGRHLKGSHYGY